MEKMAERKVSFIACAGSAAGKHRFSGCKTCSEAVESGFLRGECISGCVGVGDCTTVCVKGALRLEGGRVRVDRDKCDGCGDCAHESVCPQGLIRLIPAEATTFIPCSSAEKDEREVRAVCGFGCVACGDCERSCPVDAVHVRRGHAEIDYEKCVGCRACTAACRKKIVVNTFHPVRELKEKAAFVHCAGDRRITDQLNALNIRTCREAANAELKQGGLCAAGCLGMGDCADACRYDAIRLEAGAAWVDTALCAGCGDCAAVCPRGLISLAPYQAAKLIACSAAERGEDRDSACASGCNLCGACIRNCPNGAIRAEGGHAAIDPVLCEDCSICRAVCPRDVVREQRVPAFVSLQQAAFAGKEAD